MNKNVKNKKSMRVLDKIMVTLVVMLAIFVPVSIVF